PECGITGWFTVAAPLPDSGSGYGHNPTLIDYSFTDANTTLTPLNSYNPTMSFAVDASGNITTLWYLAVVSLIPGFSGVGNPPTGSSYVALSAVYEVVPGFTEIGDISMHTSDYPYIDGEAYNSVAGTWSGPIPVSTAPEPTSVVLLGFGLAALAGMLKTRRLAAR
ncbi:MAG: PEP-CTERM sorting domain-containing protein, partial [Terriglobia bacterium]